MRYATPRDDETGRLHPLATDQPGLILHEPIKKWRRVAIVYALLPLLCAGVGAFIATQVAYHRAEQHTDERLATLEDDLAERRRVRAEQDAERDAQSQRLLVLACVLLDHAQPRDGQIEAWRTELGCSGGPYTVPSLAPGPRLPAPSASRSQVMPPPAVRSSAAGPLPSPAPRPPSPAPSSGPLLCVDLPLLPELCL
ncbi:hypothetical protein ACFFX1_55070 [Dactylosporangium sucinum]|uniref:Uncharacterized protein n=1 Tax=Dactylosporangium sucinum TaxID=1424081 RepID=A0A917X239_9ACTN|nr:hypothetical protein [Dactylosporangium sucinum]GGM53122.1 hypothetical protein GCM10007977_063460 [Dactylosporangium sucinum]